MIDGVAKLGALGQGVQDRSAKFSVNLGCLDLSVFATRVFVVITTRWNVLGNFRDNKVTKFRPRVTKELFYAEGNFRFSSKNMF